MPRGLKQTSDIVQVSARVTETAANTYTQEQVPLTLDVLNREVFVVVAIDLNPAPADAIAGVATSTSGCISVTSRTNMGFMDSSNVLATGENAIRAAGFADGGVLLQQSSLDTPPASLDYIGIISTNDFFIAVQGSNNATPKSMSCRVWGYRAQASADIFAALTQSELLSA